MTGSRAKCLLSTELGKKMNSRKVLALTALSGFLGLAGVANATIINVDAMADSWNSGSGSGNNTGINLAAGDYLSVTAAADDLWSAGEGDRTSNANGLDPCTASGTNFGYLAGPNGFTACYGALVGRIGTGDFFVVGTNYGSAVADSGLLRLFYWDTFTGDNSGSVAANVNVRSVPEPATLGLLGLALAGVGTLRRRKRV